MSKLNIDSNLVAHNFYRGGDLSTYDEETKQALGVLKELMLGMQPIFGKVRLQQVGRGCQYEAMEMLVLVIYW